MRAATWEASQLPTAAWEEHTLVMAIRPTSRRRRIVGLTAALTIAATGPAALPDRAQGYGYCGKVGADKVYARAVKCVHARYWTSRDRCPWGWRRKLIFAEFEPAVIGWTCKKGGRRFDVIEG